MGLDKFSAALDLLKGFNVNLYVGEDIYKGKLIGVEPDHVVMETEDKYIFYYNIDKIQAITKNTRQFQPEEPTAEFQKTQSLSELLHSFHHSWVTILSINKQRFSGVLSDIDTDFATLINGEERILIKITHISNILKGFVKEKETKKEKAENNNGDKKKEEKRNEKEVKEEVNQTRQTAEKKKKVTATNEKREIKEEVVAAAEMAEPDHTLGWSEPIKIEDCMSVKMDEPLSTSKNQYTSISITPLVKSEWKKPNSEINQKEKMQEEPTGSKPKSIEPAKEKEPVKESAVIKSEPKPVSAPPAAKKESKPVKSQDTIVTTKPVKSQNTGNTSKPVKSQNTGNPSKPVKSHDNGMTTKQVKSRDNGTTTQPVLTQNAAPKKTEDNKQDRFVNDTKSVWKQKDQEKRAFRFAGEPVSREAERPFPFAGWPTRKKRTFRF